MLSARLLAGQKRSDDSPPGESRLAALCQNDMRLSALCLKCATACMRRLVCMLLQSTHYWEVLASGQAGRPVLQKWRKALTQKRHSLSACCSGVAEAEHADPRTVDVLSMLLLRPLPGVLLPCSDALSHSESALDLASDGLGEVGVELSAKTSECARSPRHLHATLEARRASVASLNLLPQCG